jgi:hypothetical protein
MPSCMGIVQMQIKTHPTCIILALCVGWQVDSRALVPTPGSSLSRAQTRPADPSNWQHVTSQPRLHSSFEDTVCTVQTLSRRRPQLTTVQVIFSTSDPGAQSRFPSPSKNCSRPLSIIQAILLYSVSFFKVISHYQVSESQVIWDNTVITHIQVFPLTHALSTKGPSALICLQRYTCQDRSIHFVGQCTHVKAVAKLCPIITRYIR